MQDGGQYNVFIGNGQTLVLGDSARQLQVGPSQADPSRQPVALDDGQRRHGRNCRTPSSPAVRWAACCSSAPKPWRRRRTRSAAWRSRCPTAFNGQHQLGVDLNGAAGQPFFTSATPAVIANGKNQGNLRAGRGLRGARRRMLAAAKATTTIAVQDAGAACCSTPRPACPTARCSRPSAGFPITLDGVTLSVASGTAQAGDSFLLQPTRNGARDFAVRVTDPAQVAAAVRRPRREGAGNQGRRSISAGAVDAAYVPRFAGRAGHAAVRSAASSPAFPPAPPVSVTLPDGSPAAGSPYAAGAPVHHTCRAPR